MEFESIADKKRLDFIINAIHSAAAPGSSILDFGCGNGIISKAIASKGFTVKAIDVSHKTITEARSTNAHPNLNYQVVPAGKFVAEPRRYQAIICSEVLEHLDDPASLLKALRTSLSDTGKLIVTVPNGYGPREVLVTKPVQYLQQQNRHGSSVLSKIKTWLGYSGTTVQSSADDLRHKQYFSTSSLRILALKTGFTIASIRSSNFIEQVFPFSLLTRRSQILQKIDSQAADLLPLSFTSGFMMVWKKN